MPVVVGRQEKMLKRVTCYNCASILEYWPNEPFDTGDTDEGHHIYAIICPACGKQVRTNP